MAYTGSKAQAGRGSYLSIVATGGTPLTTPGTVTPTGSATGGTLPAASYFYKVTALDAVGETLPSAEATVTTTGATSSVGLAWAAVTGAVSYRVYRGTAAGAESVFFGTATNSFTDTGAAGTAGTVPTANTTTGGTATRIGEITDPDLQRGKWEFEKTTNLDSGLDEEIINTIRDTGQLTFSGNRVSSDAGQLLVESAYQNGTLNSYILQLPINTKAGQTVAGDKYVFSAYVEEPPNVTLGPTKKISIKVMLKISGATSLVAGS